MSTVVINGIEYAPINTSGEKMRIVVVDNRGLTFVGRVDLSGTDEQIVIRDARCIIRWGTSEHLAELVHGPRENTQLGARHDVTVYRSNLVLHYDCVPGGWE